MSNALVVILDIGIGDALMATSVIQPLFESGRHSSISVLTYCPEVFENNPYLENNFRFSNEHPVDLDSFDKVYRVSPAACSPANSYLSLAKGAGLAESNPPTVFLTDAEIVRAQELLSGATGSVLLCHPWNSRLKWEGRSWVPEQFNKLATELMRDNYVVVVDTKNNKEDYDNPICNLNLIGATSLREMFALVSLADQVVCIDSVVMHLAQAFNKQIVAIFGATSHLYRLQSPDNHMAIYGDVDCIGCYHKYNYTGYNTCKREDDNQACMAHLDGYHVYSNIIGG